MKKLKKPKVLIALMLVLIYVASKIERREGFDWKKLGNDISGKTAYDKLTKNKSKTTKKPAKDWKQKFKVSRKEHKGCLDDYDELMNAYTGYMKKNPSKTPKMASIY